MDLPEKLKLLRYSFDYSKEYVAYRIDARLADYLEMEAGDRPLSLKQMKIISELYQLTADELVEDQTDVTADWQHLLDMNEEDDNLTSPSENTMAYLKEELASIKEMLHVLVDKLDG